MYSVFITATDTDAGKTYVSRLLLQGLKANGKKVLGLKPVAAGVDADGLNGDAKILQAISDGAPDYRLVNPLLLMPPVAPHLAAKLAGTELDGAVLDQQLAQANQLAPDLCLIEGAGGWLLPLSEQVYLADWVIARQLPVILVVGMKLGCLNHAMLTARELQRSGVTVLGWVANCVDAEMLLLQENISDLSQRLPWPRLAILPYQPIPQDSRGTTVSAEALQLAAALEPLLT